MPAQLLPAGVKEPTKAAALKEAFLKLSKLAARAYGNFDTIFWTSFTHLFAPYHPHAV